MSTRLTHRQPEGGGKTGAGIDEEEPTLMLGHGKSTKGTHNANSALGKSFSTGGRSNNLEVEYIGLDAHAVRVSKSDDEYPMVFLVTLPADVPSGAAFKVTSPSGQDIMLNLPKNGYLHAGDKIKIEIPDPKSGDRPRAVAVDRGSSDQEPPRKSYMDGDWFEKLPETKTNRRKVFDELGRLDGHGECDVEDDDNTLSKFLPPELIMKLQEHQNERDAANGTDSELRIMGPGGVEHTVNFKGLSAKEKTVAAADAVRRIGQACAPPGMDMAGVKVSADYAEFPDNMTLDEKRALASSMIQQPKSPISPPPRQKRNDGAERKPKRVELLDTGDTITAVFKQGDLDDMDNADRRASLSRFLDGDRHAFDDSSSPVPTKQDRDQLATTTKYLKKQSSELCNKLCLDNNLDPKSVWAKRAGEVLFGKLQNRNDGEKIDMNDELLRLGDCLKTDSDPDTTWDEIKIKKEILSQKAADELLKEVEEEEKAKAERIRNKSSKKAAKKKAAKEKQAAKALCTMAPIDEDKEHVQEAPIFEPEVQPTRHELGSYIQHRMDTLGVPATLAVSPPTVVQICEESKVVNLSDIGSSLTSKDDAATSVATALQCVVCMKNERAVACVPCGHKCLCEDCGKDEVIRDKKCPMCRTETKMFMKVFD